MIWFTVSPRISTEKTENEGEEEISTEKTESEGACVSEDKLTVTKGERGVGGGIN